MSQTAEQLLASALALPLDELHELIDRLTEAAYPPPPALRGEAYLAELRRRSDEIDAGRAVFHTWDEMKARAAARRAGRSDG